MEAILVQQKVARALDGKYPDSYSKDQKDEADELAYTYIILHLSDSVLRKDLDESPDMFNKIVQAIENTGDKVPDDYRAIILLNSLPESAREIKKFIMYGRNVLTPEIVVNSLKSKELELTPQKLMVRG
ncbi:G-type lectin S-receptor-like serine/threonine-protein kinase SD3-1 [Abeliophyllum distichum]|uniref:G-type lectin S-receptor-like serine/threonine-protein kinase SD3-1 n=1 Tax=Abeliophyllum distichum TaxID=126358 RepID=A0ABD1QH44_9LAMI